MNTLEILKAELALPAYSAMTNQEALDALQLQNIETSTPIQTRDIFKYLALNNKLIQLESATADSAKMANRMLSLFEYFSVNEPQVLTALTATLDALITDGLLNEGDKTAILSLGSKPISRAEELGIGNNFGIGLIIDARAA